MADLLLPTSLVGSYAQPEWLIDRKKLAATERRGSASGRARVLPPTPKAVARKGGTHHRAALWASVAPAPIRSHCFARSRYTNEWLHR
jgi:hypothetical protein